MTLRLQEVPICQGYTLKSFDMQQIIERQKVVDEYRTMMMVELGLSL